ncbi:hypothetical protein Y032_0041g467 [Ancylostoma ceylanicum]|uniref:Uncharacterized protein n=1 Tax=Ancylostoma ceylanicum TaxID=53326 RepID=A0A016UHC2_9BILA|nr:hypothetical protein Y032_0041g467 [Ancylostoma ceylanicum]
MRGISGFAFNRRSCCLLLEFSKKSGNLQCSRLYLHTVGVNGGDPSAASRSTRRDRAAHDRIVAAKANLSLLDSYSSHLMITNKKAN